MKSPYLYQLRTLLLLSTGVAMAAILPIGFGFYDVPGADMSRLLLLYWASGMFWVAMFIHWVFVPPPTARELASKTNKEEA